MMLLVPENKVAENVFEIALSIYRTPLPTGYAVGDVNIYVIKRNENAVLIDTGIRGDATVSAIIEALGAIGVGLTGLRGILLTHGHVDHAGAAAALTRMTGCPVYLHTTGHRRASDPTNAFMADLPRLLTFLSRSGFSQRTIEAFHMAFMQFIHDNEGCASLQPLQDGDVLELLDGVAIEVLHTPGHSPDSVVYRLDNLLFTGDTLLPHITPNPTLDRSAPDDTLYRPLVAFRESLKRLVAFPDAIACPGHGFVFSGTKGRCEEVLAHQEQRCEQVLQILCCKGPMTRKDLAIELFGKLPASEIYLAVSEVQAAIGYLEGRVRITPKGDVDIIEAIT